ncbi:hypothetical protein BCIN_03g01810 [Botrytis cinerea B05.10]|uniref:Uncharacterized protein n=2 Tax=Botryotinia fuckeliana TaxID=40559 RepID=A0A384JC50_BOTFB|nr:hypothetical protein BCIN_03g01810 [Botrytis cinerea B05.10]ATZ47904.1 hypothetical protein BCIN_03g01810 [Botrytis cinerea B05.10]
MNMAKLQIIIAAMIISSAGFAAPQDDQTQGSTSCFTYITIASTSLCPSETSCPARPACVEVVTNTITFPAPNTACPTTPTVTAYPNFCTDCGEGCSTISETVTTTLAA